MLHNRLIKYGSHLKLQLTFIFMICYCDTLISLYFISGKKYSQSKKYFISLIMKYIRDYLHLCTNVLKLYVFYILEFCENKKVNH